MVKVTVPVGVTAEVPGETTAVKVTVWPTVDGLDDDATVVVVGCRTEALTVCVGSDPLLALTFASPLYDAETVCDPAASVEVGELRLVAAADECERHGRLCLAVDGEGDGPRRRPLVPGAVTTAVNVTGWPAVDGFDDDETAVCVAARSADASAKPETSPTAFPNVSGNQRLPSGSQRDRTPTVMDRAIVGGDVRLHIELVER